MSSNYKACILAAGAGGKMGELTNNINKVVLPINSKATISYIVEKFSLDIEIVVAVGHKKETVINYLELAHPDRKFTFVEIDKFMGPGAGPGYSLLQCKEHLQCPFILSVGDTLVLEDLPEPKENWFAIGPVKETERYCTVKIKNNLVFQIDDKIKTDNKYAFLGISGINDYSTFFSALEKNTQLIDGEHQLSNGFIKLIEKKLVPIGFTWFDTGDLKSYTETNKNFSGGGKKFDFSKVGMNAEFLYFVNGRVIKFFSDKESAGKRVERAKHLKGLCPEIEAHKGNFYSYIKLEGTTLYDVLNSQIFGDFLHWARTSFWSKKNLSDEESKSFREECEKFYREKTMKRVEAFHIQNNILDTKNNINGVEVPSLKELLGKINWNYLSEGVPVKFHGDFKFPNILVTRDKNSQLQKFVAIDWRQGFGDIMEYGDLYYDLAKLYAGIVMSDELIKDGLFSFDMSGSSVYYDYSSSESLIGAREEYEEFLDESGFDKDKTKILAALTFLNSSSLHNHPFNLMLYYLGKSMLHKIINRAQKKEIKGILKQ